MKRIISLVLSFTLLLTACSSSNNTSESTSTYKQEVTSIIETMESFTEVSNKTDSGDIDIGKEAETSVLGRYNDSEDVQFYGLEDPTLHEYLKDNIYAYLLDELNSDEYFVEEVEVCHISREYINNLSANSKTDIYFGMTLEELENFFGNTRYIFSLDENGEVIVQELSTQYDDTYEKIVKNVAIGTGVILICVTVSVVSGGLGAPAVSMIFAASAETAKAVALSSAVMGGIAAGIITGYQTGDFRYAVKKGILAASEGLKWGSISGAVTGGVTETAGLYAATAKGLTMNEVALIQKESKWPLDVIKNIHSMEEYELYKKAGLTALKLPDGEWALVQEIDWDFVDADGITNADRVKNGLAPVDSTGKPYELHHIGQKNDSPLAILTNQEHHAAGESKILHPSQVGRGKNPNWNAQKQKFWEEFMKTSRGGM